MFVQKTVGEETPKKSTRYKKIRRFIVPVLCIWLVWLIGKRIIVRAQASMGLLSENTIKIVSENFWQTMQKDSFGNINIMLIGHGWQQHDGWLLADAIIVASRNPERKAISMISIPRDLYVDIPEYGIVGRINYAFAAWYRKFGTVDGAAKMLAEQVKQITSITAPYYAIVDFNGFEKVIDEIGGIDIYVPERIYDTTYPNAINRWYETLYIERWWQHLSGDIALKYARSRHSTSDFSRSARQQQIIQAIITKIMQDQNLQNISTIKRLYEQYTQMVKTNISIKEVIGALGEATQLTYIHNFWLTTECWYRSFQSAKPGCFLYVPNRDAFGWASVLLPNGGDINNLESYTYTQNFGYFVAHLQQYLNENAQISIENGIEKQVARDMGKTNEWHATQIGVKLVKYGFNIVDAKNADTGRAETTAIIYGTGNYSGTIQALQKIIPINNIQQENNLMTGIDIRIIIGNDYIMNMTGRFNYDM